MSTDTLLAPTDIEDALSQVYVAAVAAQAGYVTSRKDFDRDGIDITFEAGGRMRPRLDAQLTATINLTEVGATKDEFSYQCPRRNYELLRLETQVPRILVVLRLPRDPDEWLRIHPDELVLKHCAYWTCLRDAPEIELGRDSKVVRLLKTRRFDPESLKNLMEQSRSGKVA